MSSEQRRLAGRYVLEAPIGRGGMGEVWRATDTVLGRAVAIKTIDLRSLRDESGAARFEREARATAGLSNPNVVTVHDSGVEGDTAYIVMELLPGPSLAERLAEGPLPVEEVVEVGRQVASALDAAHARGLVHRDIKPGNIAYAEDGRVRVLDFGITQLAESTDAQALTATHTVMGTAEYLAPEQALGGRVDGRADLYALGCVMYALLAGQPPFKGATPVATMMMHANDPVPDVRTLRPETPDWLADLVHALLAKNADDRPAGAAVVAAALAARESLAGAATTVLPAAGAATTQRLDAGPPPPVLPPAAPREPDRGGPSTLTWVITAVAVVAIALLVWALLRDDGDRTPRRRRARRPRRRHPRRRPRRHPPPRRRPRRPRPRRRPPRARPSTWRTTWPRPCRRSPTRWVSSSVTGCSRRTPPRPSTTASATSRGRCARTTRRRCPTRRDKLVEEYDKGVQDGTITAEASDRLDPLLADLDDAVDAYVAG